MIFLRDDLKNHKSSITRFPFTQAIDTGKGSNVSYVKSHFLIDRILFFFLLNPSSLGSKHHFFSGETHLNSQYFMVNFPATAKTPSSAQASHGTQDARQRSTSHVLPFGSCGAALPRWGKPEGLGVPRSVGDPSHWILILLTLKTCSFCCCPKGNISFFVCVSDIVLNFLPFVLAHVCFLILFLVFPKGSIL